MGEEFTRYRRNLPHFRLEGATYYVTWRVHPSLKELPESAREIVLGAILHFNSVRYDLLACAVMDDHVHVVLTPDSDWSLEKLVHSWKSYTAHEVNSLLNRQGAVWLDEYYDRIVRDEKALTEKLNYIFNNPKERWPEFGDYPYLWVKGMD
ncbi:transposase [bacterium]|nr:transposase [bacterium]